MVVGEIHPEAPTWDIKRRRYPRMGAPAHTGKALTLKAMAAATAEEGPYTGNRPGSNGLFSGLPRP